MVLFHLAFPLHNICDRRSIFVKSFYKIEISGVPKKDDVHQVLFSRLASKTTDVNWTKAKDLGDHMGYYRTRSIRNRPNIQCIHMFRQFQWFNPSGKDYDKIAADRLARGEPINYRSEKYCPLISS